LVRGLTNVILDGIGDGGDANETCYCGKGDHSSGGIKHPGTLNRRSRGLLSSGRRVEINRARRQRRTAARRVVCRRSKRHWSSSGRGRAVIVRHRRRWIGSGHRYQVDTNSKIRVVMIAAAREIIDQRRKRRSARRQDFDVVGGDNGTTCLAASVLIRSNTAAVGCNGV